MATHEQRVDRCILHGLKSIGLGLAVGLIASTLIFKSFFAGNSNLKRAGRSDQPERSYLGRKRREYEANVDLVPPEGQIWPFEVPPNPEATGKRWAFLLSAGYGIGSAVAGCDHELFHREYLDPCEEERKMRKNKKKGEEDSPKPSA